MSDRAALKVSRLNKTYRPANQFSRAGRSVVNALKDVSVELFSGSILGIAGESGSGKSTLARCAASLDTPDSGEIWLDGRDIANLRGRELRRARKEIQLVLQDSAGSLSPRLSAIEAITEPLLIAGVPRAERLDTGRAFMQSVGLPLDAAARSCAQFSGGQRQRISIARALSVEPSVLILDESLAGLDLLVRAQLIDLLLEIRASRSMSLLFISHELPLSLWISDFLAVMDAGRIVEYGPVEQLIRNPVHPRTRALLESASRFVLPR